MGERVLPVEEVGANRFDCQIDAAAERRVVQYVCGELVIQYMPAVRLGGVKGER